MSRHRKHTIWIQLMASPSLLLPLQYPLIIFDTLLSPIASLSFMCKSLTPLSTTSFHVFIGLSLCLQPPTKVTYPFTQSSSSSSFLTTRPYHGNLFLYATFTMSSVLNCCLNSMQQLWRLIAETKYINVSNWENNMARQLCCYAPLWFTLSMTTMLLTNDRCCR